MGNPGLEGRGRFAAVRMIDDLKQPSLSLADADHPAGHVQGRARMGLAQEADMLFTDQQGGIGVGRKGKGHTELCGQPRKALCGAGDIEAHIHVPHLVAVPGIDPAAPDFCAD